MASIAFYIPGIPDHPWLVWLLRHDRLNLYQWFGGRGSGYLASFRVHDGNIWREGTGIGVSVPRRRKKSVHWGEDNDWEDEDNDWEDIDQVFFLSAGSHQSLRRLSLKDPPLMVGPEDTLAGHPYYKVGGPDGCMLNCLSIIAYYSTHTPPDEINRLNSYDFSCFTRFNPCTAIEDLLPDAAALHIHKGGDPGQSSLPEKLCDVPVWALARDAHYVLAIEVLSTTARKDQLNLGEVAKVRVVSSLKDPAPWLPGAVVNADVYKWLSDSSPPSQDQHLVPGRRYIVFPPQKYLSDRLVTKDSPLTFERCGVQEDTPAARRQLAQGFAQSDTLHP